METDLQERVFGTVDGENSYIFIPTNEVVNVLAETYEIGLEELQRIAEKLGLMDNLIAPKENYFDGTLELESGVKMPFDIQTLELDGLEVLDSFEENGNTYITLNGFPISAQQDDEIQKEVSEIFRTTDSFNELNRDVLEMLITRIPPEDVANLCKSDPKVSRICRDQNVFRRLLDQHYPNAAYTNDPRRQFYALVAGLKTFYRMKAEEETEQIVPGHDGVYRYHFGVPEQMHESSRIEDIEGWSVDNMQERFQRAWNEGRRTTRAAIAGLPEEYHNNLPHGQYLIFYVDGLPVSPGEKLFLLQDTGNEFNHNAEVYKRREDLAKDYVRHYDRYLDILIELFLEHNAEADDQFYEDYDVEGIDNFPGREQLEIIRRLGLEKKFNDFLQSMRVRVPFTEESLREQALYDENLYLYPDTYHDQYQVIEVTF